MVFVNDIYEIRVESVCNYSANSTDNKHYDKCVEVGNADVYGHYTSYEMYDCSRGFLVYGEIELVLLDREFNEQWRYCTQDILFGADCLHINEGFISFTDYEGNHHEVDWSGNWDAITGLITMPDELILEGWHEYKSRQKEDAVKFEQIMNKYNALKGYKHCECVYKYYV